MKEAEAAGPSAADAKAADTKRQQKRRQIKTAVSSKETEKETPPRVLLSQAY